MTKIYFMLKFITGNKTKFKEVQAVLTPIKIKQVNIDLVEIQELDPRKIIEHKLRGAFKHRRGEFIQHLPKIPSGLLRGRMGLKIETSVEFDDEGAGFIIDDSSLYLKCFDYKLPGPLVKWFNDSIGSKGYANLVKRMGENRAKAKTIIGYAKNPKSILFFEGNLNGKVVAPRGTYNFGYDPIFVADGKRETLSQTKAKGDFESSPRGIAVLKLKKYLLKKIKYHDFNGR